MTAGQQVGPYEIVDALGAELERAAPRLATGADA